MPALLIGIIIRVLIVALTRNQTGTSTGQLRASRQFVSLALRGVLIVSGLAALSDAPLLAVVLFIFAYPQPIFEWILVPLGVPYSGFLFSRVLLPHAIIGEVRGGAVFNELRVRLRWGLRLEPRSLERLGRRLLETDGTLSDRRVRGASLAARAIVDAVAGDGSGARELFAVVQDMKSVHAARSVRVYAQAWLLVDAARRGEFRQVVLGSWRGPRTCRARFMRVAARRLLGTYRPPRAVSVYFWWLLAPARVQHWSLLRAALRAEPRAPKAFAERGFEHAKARLFALGRVPPGALTRYEIRCVALLWQEVFDSAELQRLAVARCATLDGSFDGQAIVARLEGDVIAQLAEHWRVTLYDGIEDAQESSLILAAKDHIQFELLGELERTCAGLRHGKAPAINDLEPHWRTWVRVRALSLEFLDVLYDRRALLFDSVGGELLNHGAWLYNTEGAHVLAHDVFRFLYPLSPPDSENHAVLQRNLNVAA